MALIDQVIPFFLAQRNAKKNNVKVPKEAFLGLMPGTNHFVQSFLLTDVATKKAIEKKRKEEASSLLNELVKERVDDLNAIAGNPANNQLVKATRAFSPTLRRLIANRVTTAAVKTELLK